MDTWVLRSTEKPGLELYIDRWSAHRWGWEWISSFTEIVQNEKRIRLDWALGNFTVK